MRFYKINSLCKAITPITQTGNQKTGAFSLLPTKKIWFENDEVDIPYISANSIRGKLRRVIMTDFCEQIGYEFKNPHLWHSFFGGGQLRSTGDGNFDAGLRKKIYSLIPSVSLWGMSYANQALQGKLIVCDMDVLCEENKEYVLPQYQGRCTESFHRYISSLYFTRKDDLNDGTIKDKTNQAIQMKIENQVLISGTPFYHSFLLRSNPTRVEIACLHRALLLWNEFPTIGGKSATGFGQISLQFDNELDDKAYLTFLKENKESIIEYLDNLSDQYKKKSKVSKEPT